MINNNLYYEMAEFFIGHSHCSLYFCKDLNSSPITSPFKLILYFKQCSFNFVFSYAGYIINCFDIQVYNIIIIDFY